MDNPKTIIITGTSSGFGLNISARLAASGHRVIATMRNLEKKEALLSELDRRGVHADILRLDVTEPVSIEETVDFATKTYGTIDVLVNNAGTGIGGMFEDFSDEEFREQMETNFFGMLNCCRAVIPIMREKRAGRIITISSIAGRYAIPNGSAYAASKWAVEGFSESLRYEMKLWGIKVALIEPGLYHTKMFTENNRTTVRYSDEASPYHEISHFMMENLLKEVERNARDPEEIAALTEKLIMAKNPPFRSIPDRPAKILLFLRTYLPFSLFSRMIEGSTLKKFMKK